MRAIQRFEVSLKAFIVRDGRALLLREADTGWWELPGGRIDVGEEMLPHSDVLAREIAEELGPDVRIEATDAAVSWVRRRPTDGVFLFLMARVCIFAGGEMRLSDEHDDIRWVRPGEWADLTLPPQSGYADGLSRLAALARI